MFLCACAPNGTATTLNVSFALFFSVPYCNHIALLYSY